MFMVSVLWIDEVKINYDYKKYLGEDWEPTNQKPGSIVSNHQSWVDIMVHMYRQPPSHVSKASVKDIPFIGHIADSCGCLFLERENKD